MTRSSFEDWGHEELVVRRGRRSGVTTMMAVHSRALGPAAGGCRLREYTDIGGAIDDALRLSRAMTAKCAVAGIAFGGAKSVIALEPGTVLSPQERHDVLLDHADLIDTFGGGYLAGPDVGTGPDDMLVLREGTPHVSCLPESVGGTGSSSGPTAVGVLAALRAGARSVFGTSDVAGLRVVVAGFGSVGTHLATALAAAGAHVTVSDVAAARRRAAQERGFGWVEPDLALRQPVDIAVPAAVGGVLSPESVARLDARLVVGPANNQLTTDAVADALVA
ncbi:Glu/Leu/Phe/Val dehydrogenase dimerization domain-containing protein [Pseudonocardia sp. GCM10023141]|uniref:Glu/Leu/Phe/Val dehydrogenase dimerization domain-containing protein n=1 Tax=Pseudonocardia sp. GCM10023141 TaxID=3252653 RepID=UPI003620AD79